MPRLSIIIPTKNEEENLPILLSSIKEQTFTDYEVIVADAHSSDDTRRIAVERGVRVVEGGMPGEGRNKGALKAQGELLLFLDADVILSSHHFLRDIVLEFDEERADVATCRLSPMSKRPIDTDVPWRLQRLCAGHGDASVRTRRANASWSAGTRTKACGVSTKTWSSPRIIVRAARADSAIGSTS